jgi:hypothetical protein
MGPMRGKCFSTFTVLASGPYRSARSKAPGRKVAHRQINTPPNYAGRLHGGRSSCYLDPVPPGLLADA